jgi:radical SAM/Cys-rich protein
MMSEEILREAVAVLRTGGFDAVELTGGAPELHPQFTDFVDRLSCLGLRTVVRSNLTALLEPAVEGLAAYLRERGVHLIASLPCYLEENVIAQRGVGVFADSIRALKMLNQMGYGTVGGLPLLLVYNPAGPFLPGNQKELEDSYRAVLGQQFNISFTSLIALANMPVGRFRQQLDEKNQTSKYLEYLQAHFNPDVLSCLMCRHNISVDWDGTLYDCDFNLALQMPVQGTPAHIHAFDRASFFNRAIVTGEHCFGCTAGSGSSCGGALVVNSP